MSALEKSSGRILVVDDDRDAREILKRLLGTQGYECVTAADGPQCMEILKTERVDVILLDVMMPGMDGLEVCEKLRADEHLRSIPVILLTAKDDFTTRASGMELGVSEYLTKPINKHELFTRVRTQLHSRALDRELERTAANIGPGETK
jgi:PleD family two-component response regulator